MTAIVKAEKHKAFITESDQLQLLTCVVDGQTFGLPVERVHDVLSPSRIDPMPLSCAEVTGVINLRGRVVAVLDVRRRFALPDRKDAGMHIVVDDGGDELFSLVVDTVGDVINIDRRAVEDAPSTLQGSMRASAVGVCRLDEDLLVVLEIETLVSL